jgi:restriction endonuclease Mrr
LDLNDDRSSNRANWAKSYLAKAGLVKLTGRGLFIITKEGQDVLANPPKRIDIKFLEQFSDFKAFRSKSDESVTIPKDSIPASLEASSAAKGLFVTTSTFTPTAKDTADLLSKRIVLIDGSRLTKLMIRHGVGCRIEEVLHIHRR